MTITTENIDLGALQLGDNRYLDSATLYFSGSDTYAAGTILARRTTSADSYAGTITGTGTRAATLSASAGRSMKIGSYTLLAGTLSSGVGAWTMTDPDGITETYTTSAAGEDMTFELLGVAVTIADTGTDYVTADSVAFTVAAGSDFVPLDLDGVNGANVASAVLVDAETRTTAGTVAIRPCVAGEVNKRLLVIDADGDYSNVSAAVIDSLRNYGILVRELTQLTAVD